MANARVEPVVRNDQISFVLGGLGVDVGEVADVSLLVLDLQQLVVAIQQIRFLLFGFVLVAFLFVVLVLGEDANGVVGLLDDGHLV